MEVVSSLLGLSSADLTHQAALVAQTSTPAIKQEMVGQWTASRSSDAALVRASKRLSASETYSRTLTLPRTLFEGFFGPQPASGSTTALLEPSSGALLALTAESSEDGATFSLRAGPLLNALRASAGDVLVLTAAPAEEGASARALAALQSGAAAKEAGSAAGSPTCIDTLTTPALVNGGALGRDHHIAVTDDDAGEPPATASNADACNGDLLSDGGDDRGTPGEGGDGYGGSLDDQDNVMMGGEADGDDPEWKSGRAIAAGVKTRGRPRKRKSFSTAGGPTAGTNSRGGVTLGGGAMSCTHCGTQETPRWWKDTFPLGTLCNACGIWLKRHGYPRPVQFFAGPAGMAPVPTGRVAAAAPPPDASAAEGPGPGEFYLINGRPKRRRAAAAASAGAVGAYGRVSSGDASGPLPDAPINFDAAGGRVFVVRRKLVVDQASGGVTAAMVHFGWAPAARAAHEMYDRVVQYTHPRCTVAVEDFELLADTKATATLVLAAGSPEPEDWDALVRHFVASL